MGEMVRNWTLMRKYSRQRHTIFASQIIASVQKTLIWELASRQVTNQVACPQALPKDGQLYTLKDGIYVKGLAFEFLVEVADSLMSVY